MIQTETRLKVADNLEPKNFCVFVYWAEQDASMQISGTSSCVPLRTLHRVESLRRAMLSELLLLEPNMVPEEQMRNVKFDQNAAKYIKRICSLSELYFRTCTESLRDGFMKIISL